VKLCGEFGILPSSYITTESKIQKLGGSPTASGGFSEVWRGKYKGDGFVAIKVIRIYDIYTSNAQGTKGVKAIKKVRYFSLFSSSRTGLIILRTSAERS